MAKAVLITGASSGIGRATAVYFKRQGWHVAATMRRPQDAADLTSMPQVKIYRLDVTDPEGITRAVKTVYRDFGRIDVLVNNAGYGLIGPFESASDAEVRRQLDTNLMGVIRVTRAVVPRMRRHGGGVIVNLSSNAGRMAFPFYSLYNATKFAVEGLSEALYHELSPYGIRVKVIEPGPIDTDFFGRSAVVTEDTGDSAYGVYRDRALGRMRGGNRMFRSPARTAARVIFRAATDGSGRLRYPAGKIAPLMLFIYGILPDRLKLPIIRMLTMRKE